MQQSEVEALRNQLITARNEINKLRQHVRNLQHVQRKDIEGVTRVLREFRCAGCSQTSEENHRNSNEPPKLPATTVQDDSAALQLRAIGKICTVFPEKRAVPRQSSVGNRLRGTIELNADVFTNPEHSLQGLDEYSHLWVIYHFHRNSAHPKAKVAPPRLGGERVGVFSTRSPHRPCPIGLSLVEIDKIEGSTIIFFGTDMVDGTPVLDIKPYIPFYDAPLSLDSGRVSVGPSDTIDFYNSRQDPDGEESELELLRSGVAVGGSTAASNNLPQPANFPHHITPPPGAVRIPNWVVNNHRLTVLFNERAETQLRDLQVHKQCIIDILEADPRSVYLRTKHGSQIFTFQLSEVTVTCKFDDKAAAVTVVQIRRTENVQDDAISEHQTGD